MSKEQVTDKTKQVTISDTVERPKSPAISDSDFKEERTVSTDQKEKVEKDDDVNDLKSQKLVKSKLEDAINLSHLEALKQKFREHDQDDSNGLDIDEFEQAFRAILTRNQDISKEQMKIMFMKIDTNCDGTVDWDEFCTYMLLEYKERQDMNYVNETPFPNPFRNVNNSHRETVVGISFLQTLNRRNKDEETPISYSKTNGRFVTVDINGTLSMWNVDMAHQKTCVLDEVRSSRGKKGKWILAMECMSNTSKIVVSTTNRELCFYDVSAGNCDLCFGVQGFDNTITCLNYWFNSQDHNEAVLVFGDSLGQIGRLIFSSVQQGLFGADTIKKSSKIRRIMMHDIQMGRISGVRIVIQRIHRDWTKKVLFVPNYESFISCSMDQDTSLYFGNIRTTGEKKNNSSFSVYKGVNAFDFSKDYIVSGGLDTVVRAWHYSMINKPTAMMKGHTATVEHVIVSELTNSIISLSKDTVIKVWDLKDHVCLQTLVKLPFGAHPACSVYFHSLLHILIIGSKNFNLGVLERNRKSNVKNSNVKSHQKTVRAAIYNQNFNQVVSTSYDSMVCVWDLETGEKVIQFSNCHDNHEITAMTFDPTHRRLLTAAKDGSIKIWNFNNGALLGELQNVHNVEVTDILCCKNTFITGGWSRQIVIYSDTRGVEEEEPPRIVTDNHHSEDILSLTLYRKDMLAYSMYDGSIIVRNTGGEIVICRLSAANVDSKGVGFATIYYSPLACTFPADNTSYSDTPATLPPISTTHLPTINPSTSYRRTASIKQQRSLRNSSWGSLGRTSVSHVNEASTRSIPQFLTDQNDKPKQYDCSVDKLCFLDARSTSYHTATLISGGNYSIVRAWSCQGGGLLGQFQVMKDATLNDSVHAITTDSKNTILLTGDTTGYCCVYDISNYCYNDPTAHKYQPNCVHKQYAKEFNEPPLKDRFRCHLYTITNVELVPEQKLIITSSIDCSIRLWTVNGSYIGTFGQSDIWRIRPNSAEGNLFPDDIRATLTEKQLLKQSRVKRRKKKLNPWKSIKNVMAFTHLSHQNAENSNTQMQKLLDEKLAQDNNRFKIQLECDKSNILGRAYHRTTRPRKPWGRVKPGQECGSILAYSMLDRKEMDNDPKFPPPPKYMKIQGKEGLPKFNVQSLDLIAAEQQKVCNSWKKEEDADPNEEDLYENVERSKKFNEKNIFPVGTLTGMKRADKTASDNASNIAATDFYLGKLVTVNYTVKKAARRFHLGQIRNLEM